MPVINGITVPDTAKNGEWVQGRQYWNGTLSEPGVINPLSNQVGAGQLVSKEVNLQSDVAQGNKPGDIEAYLAAQRKLPITSGGTAGGVASTTGVTTTAAGGTTTGGTGTLGAITAQPTIDVVALQKSMFEKEGIAALEDELKAKTDVYNKAISTINENPWLSEASRVGQQEKLTTDFNNSIKNLQNSIATKKADIETQMGYQLKQYDINSAASKAALDQFNTLLTSGALTNASADDIAMITRSTGLSSTMIQSAINAATKKGINTSTISWDDGTNQGYAVINSDTGDIIKKQTVSASKPTAANTKEATDTANIQNLITSIKNYNDLKDIVATFAVPGGLTEEEILRYYNTYSPFGIAKTSNGIPLSINDVKAGLYGENAKGY